MSRRRLRPAYRIIERELRIPWKRFAKVLAFALLIDIVKRK